MSIKNRQNRKRKASRRRQKKRSRLAKKRSGTHRGKPSDRSVLSAPPQRSPRPTPEYYHVVFRGIQDEAAPRIDAAVADVRTEREAFWRNEAPVGEWSGETAWTHLSNYLHEIELALAGILETHTYYYWIHLYRRIGLGLHSDLDNLRDHRTTRLVRNIMEVAFLRYALLDHARGDIAHASTVTLKSVAGGLLERELKKISNDPAFLQKHERDICRSNCWYLVDFTVDDYVAVSRLESLAYEYWLTTARMRRVGKGCSIVVSATGSTDIGNAGGDDLEWLIRNYDTRTEMVPFNVSSIGVPFRSGHTPNDIHGIVASYNVDRHRWPDVCADEEVADQAMVPNFFLAPVSLGAFYRAHAFAEHSFRRIHGFSLLSLVGLIAAIGTLELGRAKMHATAEERLGGLLQLYQRGYVVWRRTEYVDYLTEAATALLDSWLGTGVHRMKDEGRLVFEFLTLTDEKRRGSGLWSLGPRYAFVDHGDALVVDLQGLGTILRYAFFGVRLDDGPKGYQFEDFFRSYANESGLEVLPQRELKTDEAGDREVDAAIRRGEALFLCECRAMERPLDLEISRPKSVATRIADLEGKLAQAQSLAEFVASVGKGRNFDFSWAKRVEHIVVSPFVEWVWSRGSSFWLDSATPRILSFGEAVEYMKRFPD